MKYIIAGVMAFSLFVYDASLVDKYTVDYQVVEVGSCTATKSGRTTCRVKLASEGNTFITNVDRNVISGETMTKYCGTRRLAGSIRCGGIL